MGINVVENDGSERGRSRRRKPDAEGEQKTPSPPAIWTTSDVGRTDDPVRMYLREMGSVELLSREGEIAIAKRIEAGRDMMIGGIGESPTTHRCIVEWRDKLKAGELLLRDIIDLDATHGRRPARRSTMLRRARSGRSSASRKSPRRPKAGRRGRSRPKALDADRVPKTAKKPIVSLAAMELTLLPQVLETFDKIASLHEEAGEGPDEAPGDDPAPARNSIRARKRPTRSRSSRWSS